MSEIDDIIDQEGLEPELSETPVTELPHELPVDQRFPEADVVGKFTYRTRNPYRGFEDPQQMQEYLSDLQANGGYMSAADAIGCNPNEISEYRKKNEKFRNLCNEALSKYQENIIKAAHRRAVHGVKRNVYFRDQKIDEKIEYSDSLMALFLKRADPEGFASREKIEVQGNVGITSFDYSSFSRRARDKMRELAQIILEDEALRAKGEVVE